MSAGYSKHDERDNDHSHKTGIIAVATIYLYLASVSKLDETSRFPGYGISACLL
jgi:hypothetical protein